MEEVDVANDIYVSTLVISSCAGDRRQSHCLHSKLLGLMELAYIKYGIEPQRMKLDTKEGL